MHLEGRPVVVLGSPGGGSGRARGSQRNLRPLFAVSGVGSDVVLLCVQGQGVARARLVALRDTWAWARTPEFPPGQDRGFLCSPRPVS